MMPGMKSDRAVETLMEVDPGFQELVSILYGPSAAADEVWEDVFAKRAPQLSPEEKRRRTEQRVAQVSNVVGLAAGTAGTASAYSQLKEKQRIRDGKPEVVKKPGYLKRTMSNTRVGRWAKTPGGAATMAAAGLGLQAGNVAGDAITARVLGRSGEKKGVKKSAPPVAQHTKGILQSTMNRMAVGAAGLREAPITTLTKTPWGAGTMAGAGTYAATRPGKKRAGNKGFEQGMQYAQTGTVGKSLDFEAEVGFSKFDEDKRLAFGWASVVEKDGLPVVDRQGDYITPEDMENAAYVYVQKSRKGGDMHRRTTNEMGEDAPHHAADLVESVVFTKEKIAKMGLPDSFPVGWWVGFKVHDEETWQEVKKGGRTGFSIHGKGKRADHNFDASHR